MKQPKILAICSGALYMSNLRTSLVRHLKRTATNWSFIDLTDLLTARLTSAEILAAAREADVIVLNGSVFTLRYEGAFRSGSFYSEGKFPLPGYADFVSALWEVPARRVFIADNLDLHGDFREIDIRPERLDAIANFYFPDRFTPRSQVPARFLDPWMDRFPSPEENYRELIKIPVQIELADCLDASEFAAGPQAKWWSFGVPGIQYARRKVAHAVAAQKRVHEPPFALARFPRQLAGLIYRITGARRQNKWAIDVSRWLHHKLLARTGAIYTDGSAYDYAVRKFLEIPAQRALLLCTPHPGMRDYGYEAGRTHIECGPDEAPQLAREMLARPEACRKMVEAAFQETWERHRVDLRAAQLCSAIERFAAGRLKSARFHEGEFLLED